MAKKEIVSVKRFGPRYGRRTRYKLAVIEAEQKRLHKCPYCSNLKAKRLAVGIWECRKCSAKFTGKAYSVSKKTVVKAEPKEVVKNGEV